MENNVQLFGAYGLLLAKKYLNEEDRPEGLHGLSDKEIYRCINMFYERRYGKSLDIVKNRKELYSFARKESRYYILCENIKMLIMRICNFDLETVDLFMLKNLLTIYGNIYAVIWNYVDDFKFEECRLSKLTKDEVIDIVRGVLTEVDPSLEWLKIYNDIFDKRIIYLNELDDNEFKKLNDTLEDYDEDNFENACVKTKKGDHLVLLTYEGNIGDVISTVHEFMHYIIEIKRDNKEVTNILMEFPSIFYEYYALIYLKRMGYSDKEIKYLESYRTCDLWNGIVDTYLLSHYIKIFVENYEINEELDIEYFSLIADDDVKNLTYDEIMKNVYEQCDACTEFIMTNPQHLEGVTSYVVGSYLALNAIDRLGKNTLYNMKDYTNNISDYNPYDIFVGLGIDVDKLELKNIEKRRKKIRN